MVYDREGSLRGYPFSFANSRLDFISKVYIFSDHNPLQYLPENAPKSSKLTRWSLALQEFNISFHYRPGKQNIPADTLSRLC
jgi:hypothetical protein